MADLDALRAGGWEQLELPTVVERYPTMLTLDERRLLHWLARDVWEGTGAIVDAGSFLGGSTVSLATGVRARTTPPTTAPVPPIATYDLFLVEDYSLAGGYFERWPQLGVDDSFRVAFDELMGDLARETEVHEGDVTAERWTRGPIEILFLDLLKLAHINDVVLPEFMPSLVAGRSVLIQQDYVHGMLPWVQVTMELLADAVEHIVDIGGSRVYAVTRTISAERLAELLPLDERVPQARQQQLMEGVVARYGGDRRGTMELALTNLMLHHGDIERATALLEHVERVYADAPEVMLDARVTRGELARYG